MPKLVEINRCWLYYQDLKTHRSMEMCKDLTYKEEI